MVSRKESLQLLQTKKEALNTFYRATQIAMLENYCLTSLKSPELLESITRTLNRGILKIEHPEAWYLPTLYGTTTNISLLPFLQSRRRLIGSKTREKNFMGKLCRHSVTQPILEIFTDLTSIIQDLILLNGTKYNFIDFGLFIYLLFEYNDIDTIDMLDQWEGRQTEKDAAKYIRALDGNQVYTALKQFIMSTRMDRDYFIDGKHPITFSMPDKPLAEKLIAYYNYKEMKNPNMGYYGAKRMFTFSAKKLQACYRIIFHLFESTYLPYRSDNADNHKVAPVLVLQTPTTDMVPDICKILADDNTRDVNMVTFRWNCYKALDESTERLKEYVFKHINEECDKVDEIINYFEQEHKVKEINSKFINNCMTSYLKGPQSSCVKTKALRMGEDILFHDYSVSEVTLEYGDVHTHCLANPKKLFEYIYMAFIINLAREYNFPKIGCKEQGKQVIVNISGLYSEHFPRVMEVANQVIKMLQPKTNIHLCVKLIPQSRKYLTDSVRVLGDNYILNEAEFTYKCKRPDKVKDYVEEEIKEYTSKKGEVD